MKNILLLLVILNITACTFSGFKPPRQTAYWLLAGDVPAGMTFEEYVAWEDKIMYECNIDAFVGEHQTIIEGLCMEAKGWSYTEGPVCENNEDNVTLCQIWKDKPNRSKFYQDFNQCIVTSHNRLVQGYKKHNIKKHDSGFVTVYLGPCLINRGYPIVEKKLVDIFHKEGVSKEQKQRDIKECGENPEQTMRQFINKYLYKKVPLGEVHLGLKFNRCMRLDKGYQEGDLYGLRANK